MFIYVSTDLCETNLNKIRRSYFLSVIRACWLLTNEHLRDLEKNALIFGGNRFVPVPHLDISIPRTIAEGGYS